MYLVQNDHEILTDWGFSIQEVCIDQGIIKYTKKNDDDGQLSEKYWPVLIRRYNCNFLPIIFLTDFRYVT